MSGNAKQRTTLTNLNEPQQMRELNRQMTWIWDQLLGGLSLKSLNPGARKVIDSKASCEEVDELSGTVEKYGTQIQQSAKEIALKADKTVVDALGNTVSEHSTAITQTAEKIESKAEKSVVNALGETVAKHESAITQTPNEIRMAVESAVESVQIGGRNLLKAANMQFSSNGGLWEAESWHARNGLRIGFVSTGGVSEVSFEDIYISPGDYTISFYGWQWNLGTYPTLYFDLKSADGAFGQNVIVTKLEDTALGGNVKKYTGTLHVDTYSGKVKPRFVILEPFSSGDIGITEWKLEQGNKATDWTPAPEDADANISAVTKRVTQAEVDIDGLNGQISSKVSKTDFDILGNTVSEMSTEIRQNEEEILLLAGRTVGGRNHSLGTGTPYTATGNGGWQQQFPWNCASVEEANSLYGNDVTISFDYETAITSGSFRMMINTFWYVVEEFSSYGNSGHVSKTFAMPAATHTSATFIYIEGAWTGSVTFRNLKLETGNTATDWSPHPDDPASSVDAGGVVRVDHTGVHMSGGTIEMETADGDEYIHIRNDGISASSLSAPNVTPRYSGPSTLYVNPNATSEQIAKGDTFRSLADAVGKLNGRYISGAITVSCTSGAALYGDAELADVSGGYVVISGNSATLYGALTLERNACAVQISKLNVSVSSGDAFTAIHCGYVGMWSNTMNSSEGTAINMHEGGQLYVTSCTLIGGGGMAARISTATLAVFANCIGTGKIVSQFAALTAGGTVPLGGVENWGTSLFNASGVTPTGADGTPAVPVISTATYSYQYSDSYAGGWGRPSQDIAQGVIRTDSSGTTTAIYGTIWFNAATIRSALSGKTIKQASLRLHMLKGYGRDTAVSVQLYGTSQAYSGRSGQPALTTSYGTIATTEPGETAEITIPTAVISDIVSGKIQALVLKSDDTALHKDRDYSQNYARFAGTATATAETGPRLMVVYQ